MKNIILLFSLILTITVTAQTTFIGFDTTVCGNSPSFNYSFSNFSSGGTSSQSGGFRIFRNGAVVHTRSGSAMCLNMPSGIELTFINDSVGFFTYSISGSYHVIKTTDFGNTWSNINFIVNPQNSYLGTYIVNENTTYLLVVGSIQGSPSRKKIDITRNLSGNSGASLYSDSTLTGTITINDTINGSSLCNQDTLKAFVNHNGSMVTYQFVLHQIITSLENETSKDKRLHVYPNPARSFFSLTEVPANSFVQLLSTNGQLIKQFKKSDILANTFNVEGVPSGMYIVKIQFDGKVQSKKIIINNR